tara:strand:+ start:448 stop:624 length:177 start_codon:yes stop_codon:yes gene_type:complete
MEDKLDIRAPRDDFLEAIVTNSHIKAVNIAAGNDINNRTPALVAIPFPPVNFRNGLYI